MKFLTGFIFGILATIGTLKLLEWLGDPAEYWVRHNGGAE